MHHLKWYNYRTKNNLNPTGPGKTRKNINCSEIVLGKRTKNTFKFIYLFAQDTRIYCVLKNIDVAVCYIVYAHILHLI